MGVLLFAKEVFERCQVPLFLDYVTGVVDTASSTEYFAVLELALVDGSLDEEQLAPPVHFSVPHFSLVASPDGGDAKVLRGVKDAPSVGLTLGPFPLVFYLAVREEELSLSMHQIIFPPALVVAAIVENVFSSAVLEIVLFLADVLVAIGVFFVHVDKLFLLFHRILTSFAELPISHRHRHLRCL